MGKTVNKVILCGMIYLCQRSLLTKDCLKCTLQE